jgi:hypothetical protein
VEFTLAGANGSGVIAFDTNLGAIRSQNLTLKLTLQTKRGDQTLTMPAKMELRSTLATN